MPRRRLPVAGGALLRPIYPPPSVLLVLLLLILVPGAAAARSILVSSPQDLLLARPVPNSAMPEKFMEGGTPQPGTAGQDALKDNMPVDPKTMAYVGRHSSLEKLGPVDPDGHAGDLSHGQLLNWVYGAPELKEAPAPIVRPVFRGSGSDGAGGMDPVPIPAMSTAVETGAFFGGSSGVTVDNNDAAIKPMSAEPGNLPSPPMMSPLPPPIMGDGSGSKVAAFQFGEEGGAKPER
jgi:hypothetical protein